MAGTTGKHQSVMDAVFFGIEQIRARVPISQVHDNDVKYVADSPFAAELEVDLIAGGFGVAPGRGRGTCRHVARRRMEVGGVGLNRR